MSVPGMQAARGRWGPNTSSSRRIRALLLPRILWLLLFSARLSSCGFLPRDQAKAAEKLTTVPEYVTRYGMNDPTHVPIPISSVIAND